MFSGLHLIYSGLTLGEGPVWIEKAQALSFVDITAGRVFLFDTKKNSTQAFEVNASVGCVAPMKDGRLLAAVGASLVAIDYKTGNLEKIVDIDIGEGVRFNDGKCDEKGRLWVGTMASDQSLASAAGAGGLYCFEKGKTVFSQNGYSIPNGIAFLSDKTFYHTDTATGGIDLCEVLDDGKTLTRKRVIDIPPEKGVPDGFCCDSLGNIWVALWGGGAVACINPKTREWLHILELPDENVSCCCFGGEKLNILYISTAKNSDGEGGNIFAVETKVKGALPYYYNN